MNDSSSPQPDTTPPWIVDCLPGGIVVVDATLAITGKNREASNISGIDPLPTELLRRCREAIEQRGGVSSNFIAEDGRTFHVTVFPSPREGAVIHFGPDKSWRFDHLRMIQSVTGVATWEQSFASDELVWSNEMYSILGLEPSEQPPRLNMWRERIHPDDLERTDREFAELVAEGEVVDTELRIVRPNGDIRWVLARTRIVRTTAGEPIRAVGLTLDVTDRRVAMEALREMEERYRLAAQAGKIGLWDWHVGSNRVVWSDRIYEFHGLRPGDFGGTVEDFAKLVHPEDRDRVSSALERTMREDLPYEIEFRTVRPDGEVRWLATSARVLRDGDGNPVRLIGASLDITERKHAQEALQRSNAELEQFAFVASHDLQEPLRAVKIYSQLLVRRLAGPDDTEAKRYSDFITHGVDRMEILIRDLLTWSRTVHNDDPPGAEHVDISECVAEALLSLDASVSESGAVVRCGCLPVVQGDPTQLQQLFQNLLSNSLKYRRNGVAPEIFIDARRDGIEWIIEISDNGIGFGSEYSDRIFGLFKRLHRDEYPGNGLGLAICKRIVERQGGRIWAAGEPGKGARFFIALPAPQATLD